jgi:amino acid transporter
VALLVLVIAATTSYLFAYIIANINVIVLCKRLHDHARPYHSPFFPIPQMIAIVAMVYVALNNSPSPEMTQTVYSIAGGMLLVISVLAALWVKFKMKRGLFELDMRP